MGNILVTGGAGYVGSAVTELLASAGYAPIVLDRFSQGRRGAMEESIPMIEIDLNDTARLRRVFAQHPIDAVVHLAALAIVSESVAQPLRYFKENVGGLIHLLEAMQEANVRKIVFSSTAAVYGTPEQTPLTEISPTLPINPYGWTKLIGEQILSEVQKAYGLAYVSLRYFNAAGATERCGEVHNPETHLIPRVLDVAAGRRPQVEIFGTDYATPDGTCIRDYIHIEDLAEAHLLALESGADCSGVYNLGSGRGYSVREVVTCAEKITGRRIPCVEVPRRSGDPPVLVAGYERISAELGWRPHRGLEEIIASAWAWLERHPKGYAQ